MSVQLPSNIAPSKPLSSIQIMVKSTGPQRLQLPINGHFRAKLFGVWFHATGNTVQAVQLRSPQMKLKYPSIAVNTNGTPGAIQSLGYPTFINITDNQLPSLASEINVELVVNGSFEIELIDLLTGVAPVNFVACIFSMNLEEIHGSVAQGSF